MESITLPVILAGPIIRRVEPTKVCIWIATSKNYRITPKIYKISSNKSRSFYQYQSLYANCERNTIRVGKQLFIHLLQVTPLENSFPTDSLIGYNLQFRSGSGLQDLASLGLLNKNNPESLVYGDLDYPAFHINSPKSSANILYGSCRKPHGQGEDTLIQADLLLKKEFNNLSSRPNSLFLMGDQIYADDVADPLFPVISKLKNVLIGSNEPLGLIEPRLKDQSFSSSIYQVNGRQFTSDEFCRFTSRQAHNHLMEFGEFAAMYLLAWSPALWEAAHENNYFETFDGLVEKNQVHFTFPFEEKESKKEYMKLQTRFSEQQEALISFQPSLYHIRRLFANIATYMIFDDHDITDDWNISANWKANVGNSPLGSHVVANGLAAYWAFQGWGNHPDSFDNQFLWTMKTYFKQLTFGKVNSFRHEWIRTLWYFDSWHFIAPTHPKTVFLDTRTQRAYDTRPKPIRFWNLIEETVHSPILISRNCWESIEKKLIESGWKSEGPLIIVSPPPVYGMGLIETFLHDYVYPLRVLGLEVQTTIDFEAWKYNGKGLTDFLTQVEAWKPKRCIILSGDVHYASAVNAEISFADGRELVINQFTSSPVKNMSFTGAWGNLLKLALNVNALKRRNKDINRICNTSYDINKTKIDSKGNSYIWKDQLKYQFIKKESVIELENNLGFIKVTEECIQNTLLKH